MEILPFFGYINDPEQMHHKRYVKPGAHFLLNKFACYRLITEQCLATTKVLFFFVH